MPTPITIIIMKTNLTYNGFQSGFGFGPDLDLYTVNEPGHPAHGGTFSVAAGAGPAALVFAVEDVTKRFLNAKPAALELCPA